MFYDHNISASAPECHAVDGSSQVQVCDGHRETTLCYWFGSRFPVSILINGCLNIKGLTLFEVRILQAQRALQVLIIKPYGLADRTKANGRKDGTVELDWLNSEFGIWLDGRSFAFSSLRSYGRTLRVRLFALECVIDPWCWRLTVEKRDRVLIQTHTADSTPCTYFRYKECLHTAKLDVWPQYKITL